MSPSNTDWTKPNKRHTAKQQREKKSEFSAYVNTIDPLSEDRNTMDCDSDDQLEASRRKDVGDAGPSRQQQTGNECGVPTANIVSNQLDLNNNLNLNLSNVRNNFQVIRPISTKQVKGGSRDKPGNPNRDKPVVKKVRFPPIIAVISNVKEFVVILKGLNLQNFRYNINVKTSRNTIYAGDRTTFDTIITIFRNNKVQFLTQSLSDERRTNLILKGVPVGFDTNDITQEFNVFGLDDKVKIVPLKEGNKASVNYYILSLAPGVDSKSLIGEHKFLYTEAKIEKFNRNSSVQCYKCSELGHGQKYCGCIPRCRKCGQEHADPKECKINANSPPEQRFCVLCNQHGHTASYKGCPTYKEDVQRRKEAAGRKSKPIVKEVSRMVNTEILYSNVASGSGGSGTAGRGPNANPQMMSLKGPLSFLDEAYLESFDCTYSQFQAKFSKFYLNYNGSESREARRTLLIDFLSMP